MFEALGVVAIIVFVGRLLFSIVADMLSTPTWLDPKYRDKPKSYFD